MTTPDLDAIRTRAARASGAQGWLDSPPDRANEPGLESHAYEAIAASAHDVPALIADRERLAAENARLRQQRDEARAPLRGIHMAVHGPDANAHMFPNGCGDLVIEVQELVRERDPARMIMEIVHEREAAQQAIDALRDALRTIAAAWDDTATREPMAVVRRAWTLAAADVRKVLGVGEEPWTPANTDAIDLTNTVVGQLIAAGVEVHVEGRLAPSAKLTWTLDTPA